MLHSHFAMVKDNEIYCPVCQKTLTAINEEYDEEYGWIFQHDNIAHDDDDIAALDNKMQ